MVLRLGAGLRKGSGVFKEPEAPRTVQWFPKHSHREGENGKKSEGPRDRGPAPLAGAPGHAPKNSWEPLTVYVPSKDNLGAVRRTD